MTRVSLLLAPLRTEVGHTHSHICIYEFAYVRKHEFIWISLTPVKENRVDSSLFLSLSEMLTQHQEITLSLSTIYSVTCSILVYIIVSEFLTNTSVRNTLTTHSTIFALFVFSLKVRN